MYTSTALALELQYYTYIYRQKIKKTDGGRDNKDAARNPRGKTTATMIINQSVSVSVSAVVCLVNLSVGTTAAVVTTACLFEQRAMQRRVGPATRMYFAV